jgi:hypothetical protein
MIIQGDKHWLSSTDERMNTSHLSSCVAEDYLNLKGSIVFPVSAVNKADVHLKLFTLRRLRNKRYQRSGAAPNPDQDLQELEHNFDEGEADRNHTHGDIFVEVPPEDSAPEDDTAAQEHE